MELKSRSGSWESVIDGVHIIMGFDADGIPKTDQGPQFVERMRGGTYQGTTYPVSPIINAWRETMKNTIHDGNFRGAYIYADPSGNDYLPGYGPFIEQRKPMGNIQLIGNRLCVVHE